MLKIICKIFGHKIRTKQIADFSRPELVETKYLCKRCHYDKGDHAKLIQLSNIKENWTSISLSGCGGGRGSGESIWHEFSCDICAKYYKSNSKDGQNHVCPSCYF